MGIVFRQSVKTTIVIFIGALLGTVITFIYTYALSTQEVGFLTNFIFAGAILQLVVQVGTGSLLITYIQKYPAGDQRRKALISLSMLVTVVATVLFSIIYICAKDLVISHYQYQDRAFLSRYYYWTLVMVGLWSLMTLLELYLQSQSKLAIATFMKEVVLRICNIALIGLVYFHLLSFDHFVIGNVFIYILPIVIMLFFAFKTKGFGFTTRLNVFSRAEYKEFIHFSWYHLLLGASLNFLSYIDTLMLAPLDKSGMSSLAAYRWAIMIIAIMVIPYRAMTSASYPVLNQAYIDKNMAKLSDLFHRAGINALVVAVGMFLLISCNLDNIVRILPKGFEIVKPVVIILMIGRMVDIASGLNNELISISKYYKFNFWLSALLLVMVVVFNRVLIPVYGAYGAAAGTTLALIIFNVIKMIFLWHKMQLQPFSKKSSIVVIAGVLVFVTGYLIPYMLNPVIDGIIRSIIIIIIYSSLLIWLKPSEDLKNYLISIKRDKKLY